MDARGRDRDEREGFWIGDDEPLFVVDCDMFSLNMVILPADRNSRRDEILEAEMQRWPVGGRGASKVKISSNILPVELHPLAEKKRLQLTIVMLMRRYECGSNVGRGWAESGSWYKRQL